MNTRSGVASIVVIAAIAFVAVVGYEWNTVFANGRNKSVADKTAAAADKASIQAAQAKVQADAVAVAVAQAQADHAKAEAIHIAVDSAASGFVEGATIALQSEIAPTPAELAASALLESASSTLGQPLTAAQRAVWVKTVGELIAQNAKARADLAVQTAAAVALRASLDATTAHAQASDANAASLAGQLDKTNTTLAATTAKSATLAEANKSWADRELGLWARIKALCWLVGLLVVGLVAYEIHRRGVTGALKDAVALKEHIQTAAVTVGADATALKATVEGWWGEAKTDRAKFEAVKQKLRL